MLIDWCCKKTQGEQASNWPKSRQEWRGGEGWQREAEGWDWAEMGGLAGNSVLEGAMGARGGVGRSRSRSLVGASSAADFSGDWTDCDWAS